MNAAVLFTLLLPSAKPEVAETPSVAPICESGFAARVRVKVANVRLRPRLNAPIIGLVKSGTPLRIDQCIPDCKSPGAWALLADKSAALHLSTVNTAPDPIESALSSPAISPQLEDYATVVTPTKVYARPDSLSRVIGNLPAHRGVALVRNQKLEEAGWAERSLGGFFRRSNLRPARETLLTGEPRPSLPLAFLLRGTNPRQSARARSCPMQLKKYERFPVLEMVRGGVRVPDGVLPRRVVRIARYQPRPSRLPAGAKWIHVDPSEGVLVAYEGDEPVFATLVSTGRLGRRTQPGLYRVWSKTLHDRMHGADYDLEEVPYSQFFNHGQALHGTFWHDRFGRAITHGCVNLSMADAAFLFDWAPPRLPSGWHSASPSPKEATLWVQVGNSALASRALQ